MRCGPAVVQIQGLCSSFPTTHVADSLWRGGQNKRQQHTESNHPFWGYDEKGLVGARRMQTVWATEWQSCSRMYGDVCAGASLTRIKSCLSTSSSCCAVGIVPLPQPSCMHTSLRAFLKPCCWCCVQDCMQGVHSVSTDTTDRTRSVSHRIEEGKQVVYSLQWPQQHWRLSSTPACQQQQGIHLC